MGLAIEGRGQMASDSESDVSHVTSPQRLVKVTQYDYFSYTSIYFPDASEMVVRFSLTVL